MKKNARRPEHVKTRWVFRTVFLVSLVGMIVSSFAQTSSSPLTICASFYPLTYFAQRIAGNQAQVFCPVPENVDPDQWFPDRDTIARLQKSNLILINGANYEKWEKKISLPMARIVVTSKAIEKVLIRFPDAITHSHGPSGLHSHEGIDGHTWMDPNLAILQAEAIKQALDERFPDQAADFAQRFLSLKEDLQKLDASLKEVSERMKGHALICSHPAFNYLARRYGWEIQNFPLDPEKMPEANEMANVKGKQAGRSLTHILWEAAPRPEIIEALESENGLKSVIFLTCEIFSRDERKQGVDYLTIMKSNIDNLRAAFPGK